MQERARHQEVQSLQNEISSLRRLSETASHTILEGEQSRNSQQV